MRYFLMGDTGGPADDFVESITLFSVKDIADLKIQVADELEDYPDWADKGIVQFIEIDTLDQANRHIDFFHKELNKAYDTDCWRHSVDLPMIESKDKDVLTQKDFELELHAIK